jgi:putative transposase
LYQGRYKSFLVQTDQYFFQLVRYVEQNPLKAKLVKRAEHWKWGSLWRRESGTEEQKKLLAPWPVDLSPDYLQQVNILLNKGNEETIENCVNRGKPFGDDTWTDKMIEKFKLTSTVRERGRPKKGS